MLLLWCAMAVGGPVEDMLDSVSDGAQVIGFGESVHGMESFAQTRSEATRYLIEKHGFRVVAVESRYLLAWQTGKWLEGEDEEWAKYDPVWALYGLIYAWHDVSTAEFLVWAREFNDAHPDDPIRLVGFDIQEPNVIHHIRTQFSDAGLKLPSTPCVLRLNQPLEVYDDCHSWFDEAEARVGEHGATARMEIENALYAGRKFATYLALRQKDPWWLARNLRDEAMADMLGRVTDLSEDGDRVVLWAHNGHLQESADSVHIRYGPLNLLRRPRNKVAGGYWKEHLGERYRAVALEAGRIGGPHADLTEGRRTVQARLGPVDEVRAWDLRVEDPFEGRVVETTAGWLVPEHVYTGWIYLPEAPAYFVATMVIMAESEEMIHKVDTWSHATEEEVLAPIRRAFGLRGVVESSPGRWVRDETVVLVTVESLGPFWRVTLGPE